MNHVSPLWETLLNSCLTLRSKLANEEVTADSSFMRRFFEPFIDHVSLWRCGAVILISLSALGLAVTTTTSKSAAMSNDEVPALFATEQVHGPVPLFSAADLHGLSGNDLAVRRKAALEYSRALRGTYELKRTILSGIDQKLGWFSQKGFYVIGGAPSSLEGGPSKESHNLLNPALLIYPELIGASIWDERGIVWNRDTIAGKDFAKLPLAPRLTKLHFDAKARVGTVSMQAQEYLAAVDQYLNADAPRNEIPLLLSALNARDLGFLYGRIAKNHSSGISGSLDEVVALTDTLATQENCFEAGSCNLLPFENYSLPEVRVHSLPAVVHIELWYRAPNSASAAADYSFRIVLE